ncbi:MAG: hypothetical protein Q9225_002438 [Loekoesia sp. 1 TL-2023]
MLDLQRLYISPLNPELLRVILSESAHESARNISYHTLQTFPEKRYGYIELPASEAYRVRTKLHGSILQGLKMKVEKARPQKTRKEPKDGDGMDSEGKNRQRKRGKPGAKREVGVLPGLELPEDRKVKRGWTEPANKEDRKPKNGKKQAKQETSAHTDGPECLFKTKIPPNASKNIPQDTVEAKKSKKRKRGDAERTMIVHEFEKTTKHPSFLRSESSPKETRSASLYVDGKGWIDKDGKVVEAEKSSRRSRSKATETKSDNEGLVNTREKVAKGDSKRRVTRPSKSKREVRRQPLNDETSSSGGSCSGNEEKTSSGRGEISKPSRQSDGSVRDDEEENEVNADQVRALSISRSSLTPPSEPAKEVHPLEALFKRPKRAASQTPGKPSLEVKTAFSFFNPDGEQDDKVPLVIPQTPFTQQDFQERRLRSAAPTPDTAAPSKTTFGRVWSQDSGWRDSVSDEDGGDAQSTPVASTNAIEKESDGEAKESEFAKWFYEHRGETNRAWKRRRREAAKEKRQKQNKRK